MLHISIRIFERLNFLIHILIHEKSVLNLIEVIAYTCVNCFLDCTFRIRDMQNILNRIDMLGKIFNRSNHTLR